ncbi:MAG: tyrosine-type recombinase/integrase [Methylocella sp.]
MSAIRLPYIKSYPDRHGKPRYYFRRKGFASVPLPAPGSPGFMAAYEAANVPPTAPLIRGKVHFLRGSLGWAIEQFIGSDAFRSRADNTRLSDRKMLDEMRAQFGAGMLRDLRSRHVKFIRDHFREKFTPSQADMAIDKLSVVWKYADQHLGLDLDTNPTIGVARLHKTKKENERKPWTDEVFAAFEANAPDRLRVAVTLLLYTGQRVSDVVDMKWSHFDGDLIEVVQQKTGETAWIPCHRRLKAVLATLPRRGDNILTAERGERYRSSSISTLVRRVLHNAGIRGYSVHGLRKNAAQALAEAGCSISEIMAITGHRSPGMALHYAKRAEKKRLARSGMKRWEDSEEPGTVTAPGTAEVSNLRTKRG